MPGYRTTIDVRAAPAEAFSLLADFANSPDWDPATLRARRLDDAGRPIGLGSRFELDMKIAGRENSIEYEVVEFRAPSKIVLRMA